tara:strand:+ start:5786 stop:6040 length:255 start_codon:yes stop_codon:yes gene_type:complete
MSINEKTNSEEKPDYQEVVKEDSQKETDMSEINKTIKTDEDYKLGWNNYSEITNGRFAMIGFFAILLIELISNKSFVQWAGLFN